MATEKSSWFRYKDVFSGKIDWATIRTWRRMAFGGEEGWSYARPPLTKNSADLFLLLKNGRPGFCYKYRINDDTYESAFFNFLWNFKYNEMVEFSYLQGVPQIHNAYFSPREPSRFRPLFKYPGTTITDDEYNENMDKFALGINPFIIVQGLWYPLPDKFHIEGMWMEFLPNFTLEKSQKRIDSNDIIKWKTYVQIGIDSDIEESDIPDWLFYDSGRINGVVTEFPIYDNLQSGGVEFTIADGVTSVESGVNYVTYYTTETGLAIPDLPSEDEQEWYIQDTSGDSEFFEPLKIISCAPYNTDYKAIKVVRPWGARTADPLGDSTQMVAYRKDDKTPIEGLAVSTYSGGSRDNVPAGHGILSKYTSPWGPTTTYDITTKQGIIDQAGKSIYIYETTVDADGNLLPATYPFDGTAREPAWLVFKTDGVSRLDP